MRDNVMSEETNGKKVSVVVCTYNGEQFLREQLESVVNQTFPLHEIIIQDDGSTDRTMQIAMEYANRYDNIIVKSNPDKQGINGNFFSAMRSCTGDFIAICDQDDLWALSEDGSFAHYDPRRPNYGLLRLLFCNEIPGHTMLINRRLLDLLPKKAVRPCTG